ncbi:MAG: aminodeoxychorismate synthase component I [Thermoanaerobaculia bacterium]
MNRAPTLAIVRPPPGEGGDGRWWRFADPLESHLAATPEEVPGLLERVERVTGRGLWAVGFVAYEAAPAFDRALATRGPSSGSIPWPLAAFSFFSRPQEIAVPGPGADTGDRADLQPSLGEAEHAVALAAIREAIAAGETYQVNFTFPMQGRFAGDAEALFWRLAPASAAPHATFLDCGDTAIVSLSPELFFCREGARLVMRPMKGTRPRGRFPEEDLRQAAELAGSAKERAENLMIVDMVRNDLGRIAAPGSVAVESLMTLERYPTVWQMTSTVAAKSTAGLPEIFAALFPCASVTGAPKARTMEWIARLEHRPRGLYCGAIGWVAPERRATFAVAIRTAVVDRAAGALKYGVGSGVVWDSEPAAEYQECLAKARAFAEPAPPFSLFETMLWRPRCGVAFLEKHLARLAASARYFGFPDDERAWRTAVEAGLAALAGRETQRQRIRLELAPEGIFSFTSKPFRSDRRGWRVSLASASVDSGNVRLFHKTTDRSIYEAALAEAWAVGADEAILWNERGELTEGSRTNLVLEIDGERLTPARECGLLAGVFRQSLLERGRVREAVLSRDDLSAASRILLVNALRGWIPAELA